MASGELCFARWGWCFSISRVRSDCFKYFAAGSEAPLAGGSDVSRERLVGARRCCWVRFVGGRLEGDLLEPLKVSNYALKVALTFGEPGWSTCCFSW